MESPVPHLLKTNDMPTMAETQEIRNILACQQSLASEGDAEIKRVHSRLMQLRHDQEVLNAYICAHCALLSPIRRIPADVLIEMFLCCLPRFNFIRPRASSMPLVLCQVSSFWRSTALATPKLWSSLSIHVTSANSKSAIEISQTWLSRTGMLPLSLKLSFLTRRTTTQAASHVLEIFLLHINRWKHISLNLPPKFHLPESYQNGAPKLETMRLNCMDDSRNKEISSIIAPSPHLRRFYWRPWNSYEPFILDLDIPWAQLTHITILEPLDVGILVKLLQMCRNLVDCELKDIYTFHQLPPLDPERAPISLPYLTALKLPTSDGCIDNTFYDYFNFPSLQHLAYNHHLKQKFELESDDEDDYEDETEDEAITHTWPCSQVSSMLSRSSCPLRILEIQNAYLSDLGLLHLLQQCPMLTDLTITNCRKHVFSIGHLLRGLTYEPGKLCLLPKLKDLQLQGRFSHEDGAISRMIKTRRSADAQDPRDPTVTQLERVHVWFSGYSEYSYTWELYEKEERGLEVSGV